MCQLAALTDRGKLQDPLVSDEGLYAGECDFPSSRSFLFDANLSLFTQLTFLQLFFISAERETMVSLLELLIAKGRERKQAMSPVLLEGEWELVSGREMERESEDRASVSVS